MKIHKSAIVHQGAKLADSVSVGPYALIGENVVIRADTVIGAHCVIEGRTTIGKTNRIFTGVVIGSPPQDLKYRGERSYIEIGDNNIIREYVTMNPGTLEGMGKTVVGSNNLFMAYSHVAHDCVIGNNCVMANNATLAGHVTLEDNAVIGGLSAVHQFVRLGRLSIVGGCSKVVQDIPPFSMCDGHPAKVIQPNCVGLKRADIDAETINKLRKAFKILFREGLSKKHALEKVANEVEASPEIEHLIFFVKTSERGLAS